MTKKAIIYCRVSTQSQKEHTQALLAQTHSCNFYLHLDEDIEAIKTIEEAGTGSISKKTLQRVLKMAEQNEVKYLVVSHTDRLARNPARLETIKQNLKKHGVEILTVQPIKKRIKELYHKIYKKNLSKAIKRGIRAAKKKQINQTDENDKQAKTTTK